MCGTDGNVGEEVATEGHAKPARQGPEHHCGGIGDRAPRRRRDSIRSVCHGKSDTKNSKQFLKINLGASIPVRARDSNAIWT